MHRLLNGAKWSWELRHDDEGAIARLVSVGGDELAVLVASFDSTTQVIKGWYADNEYNIAPILAADGVTEKDVPWADALLSYRVDYTMAHIVCDCLSPRIIPLGNPYLLKHPYAVRLLCYDCLLKSGEVINRDRFALLRSWHYKPTTQRNEGPQAWVLEQAGKTFTFDIWRTATVGKKRVSQQLATHTYTVLREPVGS